MEAYIHEDQILCLNTLDHLSDVGTHNCYAVTWQTNPITIEEVILAESHLLTKIIHPAASNSAENPSPQSMQNVYPRGTQATILTSLFMELHAGQEEGAR